ncbi:MAG: hypothetical protein AAF799_20245 [Myxococcota bacterium]
MPLRPATIDEGELLSVTPRLGRGSGEITWSLVYGPDGMKVDSSTGEVTWVATASKDPVEAKVQAEGPGGQSRTAFTITVVCPVVLQPIADVTLHEGERLSTVITLTKGTGPIDFEVSGHPRGTYIALPERRITWKASTAASPITFKVVAKGPTGTAEESFRVTVVPRDEVTSCATERRPRPKKAELQCCDFQLKLNCGHVGEQENIKSSPRGYTMKFPPTGTAVPNEKRASARSADDLKKFVVGEETRYPVYQVLAGRARDKADTVTCTVEHESGCVDGEPYSVCVLRKGQSSSLETLSWTELRSKPTEAEEYGLVATAEAEFSNAPLQGEWRALTRYNPFRWRSLPRSQWDVAVVDEGGSIVRRDGQPLRVTVEACSNITWVIAVTFSRSFGVWQGAKVTGLPGIDPGGFQVESTTTPADPDNPDDLVTPAVPEQIRSDWGWVLTGKAQVSYDHYTHRFEARLLENLQNSLGFLSVLDSAFSFLNTALSFAPFVKGRVRKPSLSLDFTASPYEQGGVGLVGYQGTLGLHAQPLFGAQFELNLLNMLLLAFPATAPSVAILRALKYGVGVKGIARVKADIGVYLIVGGEIGLDLSWTYQQPDGWSASGMIDASVDFKIEGRIEAELHVLVVSAGAGVKVGAKTAVGMCLKAASGGGPTVQGQTRWEGVVLYSTYYYKAGLKIGWFSKHKDHTTEKSLVVAKARYWPKAPAAKAKGEPSAEPADASSFPKQPFDIFSGTGTRGEEVDLDAEALAEQARKPTPKKKKKKKRFGFG